MATEAMPETAETETMEIMASNRDSLRAFLSVGTQWRVISSMAGMIWIGLDYNAVDVVMDRLPLPGSVFGDLQVMEAEALAVLNGGN
ncbi:DUF1799 domain-containing protein [Martelella lutilitoris]|uniref:DUF1799 domain-containing protein n=1 Tax=Martelella lutilitoris TaxID=2583532 RepID=A0A7T7HH45_9HYPH|nr:DUF1799 domain-containing protein [Martelella lutilitoris]QQM29047.1 DUF1799 domain-containing protein [Martelella lutilitoris]